MQASTLPRRTAIMSPVDDGSVRVAVLSIGEREPADGEPTAWRREVDGRRSDPYPGIPMIVAADDDKAGPAAGGVGTEQPQPALALVNVNQLMT